MRQPGLRHPLESYLAIRRFSYLSSLAFSPDGSQIAYVWEAEGQLNLWTQPAAGGEGVRRTRFVEESARHVSWPREDEILLGVDHHGNEQWQLHKLCLGAGELSDLTRRKDVQYLPGFTDPDRKRHVFSGNAERPEDRSLYLLDLDSDSIEPLLLEPGYWFCGPWTADGSQLVIGRFHANSDQDLFLLDSGGGTPSLLTAHEGEEYNQPIGLAADGRLLRLTDRGREHHWLGLQDLSSGELEPLWQGDWSVEYAELSRDGRRAAFTVNEAGRSVLHALELETGGELPVPAIPAGHCLLFAFSGDGRRVAVVAGTGRRPLDLYVADLEQRQTTALTESFQGSVPTAELAEAELIGYPSFDREIPAWLYRPPETGGPRPAVLWIHGGPESQERPGYSNSWGAFQYLVSRGVAVLAPNIRGSTGYGKSYQRLIHRDWGGGELRDIEAAARWLQKQSWIDPQRIAVMGGSFGGFATLSALTRLPDFWASAVDLFGPSNLLSFVESVPPFWKRFMTVWVGDPETDRGLLVERSPITYVEQARAPLLVIAGATDPRVVKAESDQMVQRLRELGRPVEYLVFEDEGHGFSKTANQVRAYGAAARFLSEHLHFEY